MANVTKAQFINDLNAYLQAYANAKKNANSTDVSRSGNEITLTNYPAVSTGELSTVTVSGPDLQAALEEFTKQFSRVRLTKFYKNQYGTNVFKYSRFARINNTLPDGTRSQPSASTYNNIQPLEDINLTRYHTILSSLQTTLNINANNLYKNYYYCHSSCHSSCHASRGRR